MKIEREKKNLSPTDGDHTKHLFLYTHSRRKRMNDIRQVTRRSCQSKDPYIGEYLLKRIKMNDQKFIIDEIYISFLEENTKYNKNNFD